MTHTNPAPSDPIATMATYAGASEAHSRMHGRTLMLGTNVLEHGADPTGTNDSAVAFQAAADAVASGATLRERTVWVPGGTYKFATGTGVTANYDGVRWHGTGSGSGSGVTIQPKNAYAFTGTGRVSNVFENISVELQSGSTSGGGWNFTNGARNRWQSCNVTGVSGYTGSLFLRTNGVFDKWVDCTVQTGGIGFDLESGGANTNLMQMIGCTAQLCSTAGFYIDSPQGVLLQGCDAESNTGYGVQVAGSGQDLHMDSCWFESNTLDSLRISGLSGGHYAGLHFASGASAGGANHITLTGTCYFQTFVQPSVVNPADNKSLAIGASVDGTIVIGGRGFTDALVTDSGTNSKFINTGHGGMTTTEAGYRFGLTRGLFVYAGSPEGNVTADKGSICLDTANGAAYIKTTDSVNTGWKAITHA